MRNNRLFFTPKISSAPITSPPLTALQLLHVKNHWQIHKVLSNYPLHIVSRLHSFPHSDIINELSKTAKMKCVIFATKSRKKRQKCVLNTA